jgi:hypothetical protein
VTVPVQDPFTTHTANGVSDTFAYDFLLLLKTDLTVIVGSTTLGQSDFSITGLREDSGGTITILAGPPTAGTLVQLLRQLPLEREIDYQTSGDFRAPTVNDDFDRIWMALQDAGRDSRNALKYPFLESIDGTLPAAGFRKGMLLGFDQVNGVHEMVPYPTSIGAGDLIIDTFLSGVDFTPGVTTQLTLSRSPGAPANLIINFDGFTDFDWIVAGNIVTFNSPIPVGITTVRARIGTTLSMLTPPDDSIGDAQLIWDSILARQVNSIADMQALDITRYQRVNVAGYYGAATLGGGFLYYDAADTTTPVNNGTVFASATGPGRWKRPPRGYASFCDFGCIGDGATDDSVRAQACIDAFAGARVIIDAGKLFFCAGLALEGGTYNNTIIESYGQLKMKPDAGGSTFGGAWVGILLRNVGGVKIKGTLRINGNRSAMTAREQIFCVALAGINDFQFDHMQFDEIRGDGLYIAQFTWGVSSQNTTRVKGISVVAENVADDGRNAISIISGTYIDIDTVRSIRVGGTILGVIEPGGIDIEPDAGYETCANIRIGFAEIVTAGTSGLGIFGKSISGVDANRDWNCFDITFESFRVLKTGVAGSALTATPYLRCARVKARGSYAYDSVRGEGLTVDYAQFIEMDVTLNNVSVGIYLGRVQNLTDFSVNAVVSSYREAAIRTTGISRGRVTGRVWPSAAGGSPFGVQAHNEGRVGLTQENVIYSVDVPYDGQVLRAMRNEPGALIAFGAGCVAQNCNWSGYPSNLASDATIDTRGIAGWNYQDSVPSVGTWTIGTRVDKHNADQTVPGAGKILTGWVRLNTGSNNVLNTDWSQIVATIS